MVMTGSDPFGKESVHPNAMARYARHVCLLTFSLGLGGNGRRMRFWFFASAIIIPVAESMYSYLICHAAGPDSEASELALLMEPVKTGERTVVAPLYLPKEVT